MKEIAFTKVKLPFGWLGNMSPHLIEAFGRTWRTSEALFQALRFDSHEIREKIRSQKSPMAAKFKAKKHRDKMTVEPLSETDIQNMRFCVMLKAQQHDDLRQMLLETGDMRIIEDCTNRGRRGSNLFWGAMNDGDDEWEGYNGLGVIWMEVRDAMRHDAAEEAEDFDLSVLSEVLY